MMIQSESGLEAFRNFEKTAHDRLAKTYHNAFSAVTNRAIEPLLDAAQVREGTRLLDVASGPGKLAGRAAERGALVVGTDIAPSMVVLARTLYPTLDFREASAEDLPFAASSFDSVICSFGIGHFSKPDRVLLEFVRVLVPKGRAALSWWDGFGQNRINGIFFDVINELGVKTAGALPAGLPLINFQTLTNLLRYCGWPASRPSGYPSRIVLAHDPQHRRTVGPRAGQLCAYIDDYSRSEQRCSAAYSKGGRAEGTTVRFIQRP
jgi:ubiquinone/menaquinone biosynthesis C-methylase UbiE